MTATPSTNPNAPGTEAGPKPQPSEEVFQRLLLDLPDPVVYGTRQLSPGQTNLQLAAQAFAEFGQRAPTQADLDKEAARRVEANKNPSADPPPADVKANAKFPGAQGRAQAAKRGWADPAAPAPAAAPAGTQARAQAARRFGQKR